jgi:glutaconate CoA-transferase subunit A
MNSKVRTLSDVVSEIPDRRADIALGGFAITRCPMAFANELVRQGKKEINLYEALGSLDADILVGAGLVRKLIYTGGSLDRFGRLARVNEAIENGTLEIEEYSILSMNLRLMAGAMGLPFIASKTLLGTEILENLLKSSSDAVKVMESPFDRQEKYVCYRALQPEYVVIHGQYADRKGNVVIQGPVWDEELAKSAKKLIAVVDRIVSNESIKQHPEFTVIPSLYTYAVCEVPFGAYPTAVYKSYDYDAEFLKRYGKFNQNKAEFDAWLGEYVLGTKDHGEFILKMAGMEKLCALQADPVFGYAIGGGGHGDK